MPWINWTDEVDFTLFGFSRDLRLQYFQFGIFLLLYLMSLVGNLTITVAICLDQKLHTPMYFFLGNLSFLDICYSSVTVPKMLVALLGGNNKISYRGCMSQLYFYVSCCSTECLLLSVMAYDRYVAICNPMRYTIIMSKKTCFQLATGLWLIGFISSVLHTVFTARLPYCGSHRISHFFCDIPPMLKLSCTDTFMNKVLVLTAGGFLGLSSFVLTLISYVKIISTILNIRTNIGRGRAFSTCASHLTVVTIFFGSISFMYMRPTSSNSFETDKLISFLYAVLTPALNPMIYTLRNKEFKVSLKKTGIEEKKDKKRISPWYPLKRTLDRCSFMLTRALALGYQTYGCRFNDLMNVASGMILHTQSGNPHSAFMHYKTGTTENTPRQTYGTVNAHGNQCTAVHIPVRLSKDSLCGVSTLLASRCVTKFCSSGEQGALEALPFD
ncbi:hypothetical protein XELAEV_18007372mg [Xenopus laevis]|uniref:G-protein coupled receptors family 1 profile domain-containing protein n=1 Tax=Xenopus laevis TaxID=8355 RepID=A0A974E1L2_XENLA|nr:hypothetical protein XELAEV_18007372mg [Xenopus laevis]